MSAPGADPLKAVLYALGANFAIAVAKFIAYAKSHPDVWFARRIEIARHWQEHHP